MLIPERIAKQRIVRSRNSSHWVALHSSASWTSALRPFVPLFKGLIMSVPPERKHLMKGVMWWKHLGTLDRGWPGRNCRKTTYALVSAISKWLQGKRFLCTIILWRILSMVLFLMSLILETPWELHGLKLSTKACAAWGNITFKTIHEPELRWVAFT